MSSQAHLLGIPLEIRLLVWHELFTSTTVSFDWKPPQPASEASTLLDQPRPVAHPLAILLVNRQCHDEAKPLGLRLVTLSFPDIAVLLDTLSAFSPHTLAHINHVRTPLCTLLVNDRGRQKLYTLHDALGLLPHLHISTLTLYCNIWKRRYFQNNCLGVDFRPALEDMTFTTLALHCGREGRCTTLEAYMSEPCRTFHKLLDYLNRFRKAPTVNLHPDLEVLLQPDPMSFQHATTSVRIFISLCEEHDFLARCDDDRFIDGLDDSEDEEDDYQEEDATSDDIHVLTQTSSCRSSLEKKRLVLYARNNSPRLSVAGKSLGSMTQFPNRLKDRYGSTITWPRLKEQAEVEGSVMNAGRVPSFE